VDLYAFQNMTEYSGINEMRRREFRHGFTYGFVVALVFTLVIFLLV